MSGTIKVVHIISGLGQGGAEQALYRLANRQLKDVDSVVISLTGSQVYGSMLTEQGIPVIALRFRKWSLNIIQIFRLWRILRHIKPDVVQTWMYHADLIGGIIGRLAGIKKIFWGVVHYNLDRSITSPFTLLVARICASMSRVIPKKIVSCAYESVNSHVAIGYDKSRFVVIPLGFDTQHPGPSRSSRSIFRALHNISDHTIVIGCVARWHPQKDHANLVAALGQLMQAQHEVVVMLVGAGLTNDNTELIALLKKHRVRDTEILRLGRLETLEDYYSALDIFVLPSRGEAFPNVIAEAMSFEVPCIATDVGDIRTIIGSTGWIVPPRKPRQLAQAMARAIRLLKEDRDTWAKRKVLCRRRICENFSLDKMSSAYLLTWRGN